MTLDELNEYALKNEMPGNSEIVIKAMGGMRGGKAIKEIQYGFDFDPGMIVLVPEVALWTIPANKPKKKGKR